MEPVVESPQKEEEGSPNPKRMRPSYSCGGNNSKACIVFYCDRYFPAGCPNILECHVCIVDLKSDIPGTRDDEGFALVSSTLQIDCGNMHEAPVDYTDAFCVLGEKLYMVEGGTIKKSVFAFDLTQTQTLTRRTTKLVKGDNKIGDMMFPKRCPAALPLPDGQKIVVFPTLHFVESHGAETSFGAFELLDPAKPQSPEQLPSIPVPAGAYFLVIEAYGFVHNSSKLLVQTSFGGLYVLDLAVRDVERSWEKWGNIYARVERIPLSSPTFFETVEDGRFCFANTYGFCDLKEYEVGEWEGGHKGFVGFPPPLQEELASLGMQTPFTSTVDYLVARCLNGDEGEKKGEYHFCQLLMECQAGYIDACRMAITVCRVDLKSYKELVKQFNPPCCLDLELKHDYTTVVETHKFSLGHDGGLRLFAYKPHLFFTF